jgi:hypothetical protein
VFSLAHVDGERRIFAGLENGELVSVDLASVEVASRTKLGGGGVRSLLHTEGERRLAVEGIEDSALEAEDLGDSFASGLRGQS